MSSEGTHRSRRSSGWLIRRRRSGASWWNWGTGLYGVKADSNSCRRAEVDADAPPEMSRGLGGARWSFCHGGPPQGRLG